MDRVNDSWYLDSGPSYHMCLSRDRFDPYKSHGDGSILTGDEAKLMSIGIRTIKIQMFDKTI